ncbi:MAG: hypothetical protein ABGY96_18570 [bacterium]|nr:hypothetical protein [Pseudomonadales bacterium]
MRDLPDDLPDQQRQHKRLEYIRDSGLQAAAVVQDLLALARRGITKQQATNLNDIVASYFDSPEYYALVSSRGDITMDLDIRPPLPNIAGSPAHINNVIMNLIINSVEAQPEADGKKWFRIRYDCCMGCCA